MPAIRLLDINRRIDVAAFELNRCLEEVDAIVSPTTPQAAPAFDGPAPDNAGAYCILANFAGNPAISAPMGCNAAGLPLGLQIIGALHRDAQVLEIAASYEAAAGLDIKPPPPYGDQA
jgi:aspartyl-tRNA(Asn)/glutamyl-tRNA(Gln) amidotransferase subunit A